VREVFVRLSTRRLIAASILGLGLITSATIAGRGLSGDREFDPVGRPDLEPILEPFTDDPYEAAQLGSDWLVSALCNWMQVDGQTFDCVTNQTRTCFGCHVQAETVLGLARSEERCYTLPITPCFQPGDESRIQFAARFVAGAQRKDCIRGTFSADCALAGIVPTVLDTLDGQPAEIGSIGHYEDCGSNAPPASIHPVIQSAHGGLNLAGYTRYVSPTYSGNLVALADWFVGRQDPSGTWVPDRLEAPVDQGASFCTGSATMVLNEARAFGTPGQVATYDAAIDQARIWTSSAIHVSTQDRTFAIITLLEAGAALDDPDLVLMRNELLALQQADGGWSERPGLASNPYATGQAVNALFEAGLTIEDGELCTGIGWLVTNQNLDGSWDLGTVGVETDSGRNSQFVATIWPVLALGNLRPFGADINVSSDVRATCEDQLVIPVQVTHAADTACGLFARDDDYEITVTNDSGDMVRVEPAVVTLGGGDTATLLVYWERNGALPPPGTASITTLQIESIGARDAGCPVFVDHELSVVVPTDVAPGPVDDSLRVALDVRDARDLVLEWAPLDEDVGPYEVVAAYRPRLTSGSERPTRTLLDSSPADVRADLGDDGVVLVGEASLGGPALSFYKVRGTSSCRWLPGPTCNYACGDPDRCDGSCP
jgi:hypothetical protein